mmetsp:Transcript_24169/g.82492  ORF Transcript_24169/g.82492 Transcript_24169/m.82492 type:complete len:220 (+) Transcript_24169:632-1291(+)
MHSSLMYSGASAFFATRNSVVITSLALNPCPTRPTSVACASSISPLRHLDSMSPTASGCGWSQTWNTFSALMYPKPLWVACRLLSACRMSPSAVNTRASRPSGTWATRSASTTRTSRSSTSASVSRLKRTMAHRLWMGSMIFSLWLHARAKRVVELNISIVRRMACCAAPVMESASSRMTILCRPGGSVTFFCANIFILLRTTSMPRSSEAFISSTASL